MDRYGMSVTDEPGSYRPPVRYVRTLHAAETVTLRYVVRYTVHEQKQQVSLNHDRKLRLSCQGRTSRRELASRGGRRRGTQEADQWVKQPRCRGPGGSAGAR